MRHCGISMLSLVFASMLASAQSVTPTIKVTTACEAMNPSKCKGAFGFVIDPNGNWKAGVGPDSNRAYSGKLTDQDWSRLRNEAAQISGSALSENRNCIARPRLPGVSETLLLEAPGQSPITLRGAGGELDPDCDLGPNAKLLFKIADELMRRYYPDTF